jgi:hypothetical protein
MWAATPIDELLSGSAWGPTVGLLQSGLEQRYPTLLARSRLTVSVKLSLLLGIVVEYEFLVNPKHMIATKSAVWAPYEPIEYFYPMPEYTLHKEATDVIPLFQNNINGDANLLDLEARPGVYCFWWIGHLDGNSGKVLPNDVDVHFQGPRITEKFANSLPPDRVFEVQGTNKKKEPVTLYYYIHQGKFSYDKVAKVKSPIPLYIGKTTSISRRVGEHILINKVNRSCYLHFKNRKEKKARQHLHKGSNRYRIIKRDSSSQLRAGLEYLFRGEDGDYAFERLKDSLGISYVSSSMEDFQSRFYLEELAIGTLRPWFNLDGER